MMVGRACTACGGQGRLNDRFCSFCGATMHNARIGNQKYSPTFINVTRVLAVAALLSGVIAAMRFETTAAPGRFLITTSLCVSLLGQFFIWQALKPDPRAWLGSILTLFWLGLIVLAGAWALVVGIQHA
jgi:hypothetical protein